MTSSKTVDTVMRGDLCTGCGLCASVSKGAISMTTLAPGYTRPTTHGSVDPDSEKQIASACPGAIVEGWSGAPNIHFYWGPWRSASVGYANEDRVRWGASSGGVLSALLMHALRSGMVDRVIHIRADPSFPTRNIVALSTTDDEVMDGAGSRYSSSSPLAVIERELENGGSFAFVGKPCDVSALRRLAKVDPRVDRHIPLALSFFCAGVPSHDAADRVIRAMGANPAEVTAFRYRGEGWPGNAAATLQDGSRRELTYAKSWGEHLAYEVQFRCKICPDGVGGAADVACGDAWYGDTDGYPSFEEQDGRSLIVARTEAGVRLLESAKAAGLVGDEPLDIAQIDLMQPGQTRRKRLVRARLAALAVTFQPIPVMTGTYVTEASRRATPREQLHNFLGTIRRVLNGRRSRL